MFHLIKFIITFWTFIITLSLMIEHMTLETEHFWVIFFYTDKNLLLILKNFYNYMDINYIEIYLSDLNDYKYDFGNPKKEQT